MILKRTVRPLVLAGVITGALLLACAQAQAQHHGGGGYGGGMGGGMDGMGSARRDGMADRDRMAPQPMRSGPQLAPPGRWWDDNKTIKKLSLSPDQKQHMDDIFNAHKDTLVSAYAGLQREESRLNSMPWQDLQDQSKVDAAIDRVTQARGELAKEIAHVQMQLRQQLTPAQLNKLNDEIASLR